MSKLASVGHPLTRLNHSSPPLSNLLPTNAKMAHHMFFSPLQSEQGEESMALPTWRD